MSESGRASERVYVCLRERERGRRRESKRFSYLGERAHVLGAVPQRVPLQLQLQGRVKREGEEERGVRRRLALSLLIPAARLRRLAAVSSLRRVVLSVNQLSAISAGTCKLLLSDLSPSELIAYQPGLWRSSSPLTGANLYVIHRG